MTEQELAARAGAGDTAAFEQLVRDHQNRVFSLAFRMVNDREEAEDLAQEAFLKAWQGLPSFQGDSSFSTWIYRLTTNVCIDFLRKQKRRRDIEPVASLDDGDNPIPEPSDPGLDPHRQMEQAERSQVLSRGLRALPDHQRQILVMREISGLSYQEIGAALELDLGTVKSRIARARLALRKILLVEGNLFGPAPSNQRNDKT